MTEPLQNNFQFILNLYGCYLQEIHQTDCSSLTRTHTPTLTFNHISHPGKQLLYLVFVADLTLLKLTGESLCQILTLAIKLCPQAHFLLPQLYLQLRLLGVEPVELIPTCGQLSLQALYQVC